MSSTAQALIDTSKLKVIKPEDLAKMQQIPSLMAQPNTPPSLKMLDTLQIFKSSLRDSRTLNIVAVVTGDGEEWCLLCTTIEAMRDAWALKQALGGDIKWTYAILPTGYLAAAQTMAATIAARNAPARTTHFFCPNTFLNSGGRLTCSCCRNPATTRLTASVSDFADEAVIAMLHQHGIKANRGDLSGLFRTIILAACEDHKPVLEQLAEKTEKGHPFWQIHVNLLREITQPISVTLAAPAS